jgi:hypothetical protein
MAFATKMLCLLAILPFSTQLQAQSFYGSIVGTVTDASGAVVPGATVKVTNAGTNTSQTVQSDGTGKYSFVDLLPATYRVEATKASFKRFVRESVDVAVGSVVRIDLALAVGNVSETVEVSTATPLLQTDSSSLNQEVVGDQVQEMPLNGRNVQNLIALAPGVIPTGSSMGSAELNGQHHTITGGFNDYEIGGALQGQSGTYVDGVSANVLGGNTIALIVTQDAIQEFNVATSNAGADFGHYSGGVVNMATKSGTNTLRGSFYEYFRNDDLNANDYFSNLAHSNRVKWDQNQYGAIASGPIKKDKAFLMLSWEEFSLRTGWLNQTYVPTVALQNGVFLNQTAPTDPGALTAAGTSSGPICDIEPIPVGGVTINGTTFTGTGSYIKNLYVPNGGLNTLNGNPTTCGDPLNKVLKTYYPAPNSTLATANFFLVNDLNNNTNQYNGRFDYNIASNQRAFIRYTFWRIGDGAHSEFSDVGYGTGVKWPTNDGITVNRTHQAVIGDTVTFNPTTVLDVRVNYMRLFAPNPPQSITVDETQFSPAMTALAPQFSLHELPSFNVSGIHSLYNNWGAISSYQLLTNNAYGLNFSLVKILGRHSLKFGGEDRLLDQTNSGSTGQAAGTSSYSNSSFGIGDEWAAFLMGYPTSVSFQTISPVANYNYYQGYYATDTWQAARNLTLTLGLRYELPGGAAERHNKGAVVLPNAVDPYTGITGTETLVAGTLYAGRTGVIPPHNLFAPRLGFAYRVNANTVLRGGYGISYLFVAQNPSTPITTASTSFSNSGTIPAQEETVLGCWANLLPTATCINNSVNIPAGLNLPIGRSQPNFVVTQNVASATAFKNQSINGPIPYQSFPYTQQWNVDLSHQFKGDWVAEISYSGTKGTNLPAIGRNLNELPDQYDSMGAALQTKQACAATPGFAANAISAGQCLRPYPYYNNFSDSAKYVGISSFKAVEARTTKRFGRNGVLTANYTWSKNQGDTDTNSGGNEATSTVQGQGGGVGALQDYNNLGAEYAIMSYDVTNRTIISYVLPLPFGKGQKFANSYSGIGSSLVSGWAINGITTFQSGFPLFMSTGNNNLETSFGASTERPNIAPGCNKFVGGSSNARVAAGAWFNTSCFTTPANYTFGNAPRVDPNLRTDGQKNFDFAFQKSTALHELSNLEFRAEFFNIMNRVQFAPPNTQQNSGTFGQVVYQVNQPRKIQLSLRLNY